MVGPIGRPALLPPPAPHTGRTHHSTPYIPKPVGVKVVVRVRKLLSHELADGCRPCVLVEPEGAGVVPQQVRGIDT